MVARFNRILARMCPLACWATGSAASLGSARRETTTWSILWTVQMAYFVHLNKLCFVLSGLQKIMKECLCEKKRQQKLLSKLQSGSYKDVPPDLLLDLLLPPHDDTRPFTKLVKHYSKRWQARSNPISPHQIVALISTVPAVVAFYLTTIGLSSISSASENPTLLLEYLGTAHVVITLAAIALLCYAIMLLHILAFNFNDFCLDLNGVRCVAYDGYRFVSWKDVYTVTCVHQRWIRLTFENGGQAKVRVPKEDRRWLLQVIKELLRQHHNDLYGVDPESE